MIRLNLHRYGFLILLLPLMITACEPEMEDLEPATFPTNGDVFLDGFTGGLNYAAFGGSVVTAFTAVSEGAYAGAGVMRFDVPDFEDPTGAYAGGTYFLNSGRDLSGYTTLSFWARASQPANVDIIGFGNDLGANRYQTAVAGLPVGTAWKKYYIPIPDPSRLRQERGLFFYSEGPENQRGYTFWIDEVKFEKTEEVRLVSARIFGGEDRTVSAGSGATFSANGVTTFNLPTGVNQEVQTAPAYFSFSSSDPDVATVNANGLVTVQDTGTAVITATINGLEADGSLTVSAASAAAGPDAPAPSPDVDAEEVISIFSNTYENEPVDFYNGYWEFSTTQSEVVQLDGDDILRYTMLNFVGIQFTAPTIDVSEMTNLHLDIWTPDPTASPATFKVLLLDVGPDGAFGGNDDTSHELTFTAPTLRSEEWVTLDIPLSEFSGLTGRGNLAQIVLSGDLPSVYVDNVFFYRSPGGGGGTDDEPQNAAPTLTIPAGDVLSIFSDTYTNVGGNLNPDWGQATQVSEIEIQGNNTLRYGGLNYQGLQLDMAQNVADYEFLHIDYWSANATTLSVYPISEGPEEKAFNLPVPTDGWASIDIPISEFDNVDPTDLIQLKFEGDGDVYLDNIIFYRAPTGEGDEPSGTAATPERNADNVISLFSDAYTDVPVDTWRTGWSAATLDEVTISGNAVKKYSELDFVGVETLGNPVDASEMTHVHVDVWTPDATLFALKLVDAGADATIGTSDDSEHQVDFPDPAQGTWVSYDIPLADFSSLTARGNLGQYILVGQPSGASTVFIDNFYFYRE